MKTKEFYNEITEIIENYEVNRKVRERQNNREELLSKWKIGKLLVEAQGGELRAKYGNELINKWSKDFTLKYGKSYSKRNLMFYRQFYLCFPIVSTVSTQLSYSHLKEVLPIKNENERNYYINQVILNNLSVRELRKEIKNKSFDRLSYADKNNIKLIDNNNNLPISIRDMIKDPIILETNKNISNLNEKVIHKELINLLENKFLELGTGFTLAGHEYKITLDNKTYKIDLLFFNVEINAYVVVEVKNREFKPSDIGQIDFYMKLVDDKLRKNYHNKTEGILIVKEKNKYVVKYMTNDNIYITNFCLDVPKVLN